MKKSLIIAWIALLLIGGLVLLNGCSDSSNDQMDDQMIYDPTVENELGRPGASGIEMSDGSANILELEGFHDALRSSSVTALKENGEKVWLVLEEYNEGKNIRFSMDENDYIAVVYDVDGDKITGTYARIEAEETIEPNAEDAVDLIKSRAIQSTILCENLFDTPCYEKFQVIHEEGLYLTLDNDETYAAMLEGKCYLQLFVREADGTIWKINGKLQEEKYILTLDRYFDPELFKNVTAEITLK